MPFIRAGDIVVHYQLEGPPEAPLLMFGNSLGTNFHVWDAPAARLSERYRLLRYDMRGHGLTDCPEGDWSIDLLARDAVALLDALHLQRFSYCGLSIGGMVGQRLGAIAADRLDTLVLADTAMVIGPPSLWEERVAALRKNGLASLCQGVMARWFTRRFHEEQADALRGFSNMLVRTPAEGYAKCGLAIRDADLTADARRIACPTLVLVGEEDGATTPEAARALRDAIGSKAQLSIIPGCAHIPPGEKPDEFTHLVVVFLEKVLGRGEGYEPGMAVRRSVLGAAHVERSTRNATDFDRPFQEFITKYAWGGLWTRPALDRRTRSLVTLAMLSALGRENEFRLHVRATQNTGVTQDELREVLFHTAIYAGVPAANAAFGLAKQVLQEMEEGSAGDRRG
jgi:3-oxoadipate enol-lactonase / 4-carboxymuconolactone decarboxylase